MAQVDAKKQERRETIENGARFLLMLDSCEEKFCERFDISENELQ